MVYNSKDNSDIKTGIGASETSFCVQFFGYNIVSAEI